MEAFSNYKQGRTDNWQGKQDTQNLRLFQKVKFCNLQNTQARSFLKGAITLLGFCSDEGVRRNQGRLGASEGPKNFRQAFANLAYSNPAMPNLFDVGDIICSNQDLEAAQLSLAKAVNELLNCFSFPLIIGGGHETTWGVYLGLQGQTFIHDLAIVNFDAHFDMREQDHSTSGSAFFQIAQSRSYKSFPFSYYCFGIQPQSNTKNLFSTAQQYEVHYRTVEEIYRDPSLIIEDMKKIIAKHQAIYLSLCLDVFAYPYAPGVSASSSQGLTPWQVIPAVIALAKSKKVKALDIVELAPKYDQDNITAKLAATLASYFLENQFA